MKKMRVSPGDKQSFIKKYFIITGNPRYIETKQEKFFPQKLLNIGAESLRVLRLRWMHKLAMSHSRSLF